ncbi:MAG: hypothetical protein ACOYMB_00570 [Patescibacteria group bacterium]
MIDEHDLNKIDFTGANNLEKMKRIYFMITGEQKINLDFWFWLSLQKNNPEVSEEIKNLVMDFLVSKANDDFYGEGELSNFFTRNYSDTVAEAKFWDCCFDTDAILENVVDGKEDSILFQKITIKKPVFFDQIIKKLLEDKKNYLLQFNVKRNIFLGKKEAVKAIFGQFYGNVFRVTTMHSDMFDKVMHRLSLHLANQQKERSLA